MKFYFIKIFIPILFTSILFACSDPEENKKPEEMTNEELANVEEPDIDECQETFEELDTFPKINYTTLKIKDYEQYLEIKNKFGDYKKDKWAHKAFITLNRREFRYVKVGDSVVVPDTVIPDMRAYSVYPPYYCDANHIPKLIMVSNKYQCYAAYEFGKLVRFAAANTGKEKTPTFPGRYALVWRDRIRKSSLDSNWVLPYTWNFHRYAGNAFHQFDMPGRAVSHSCIRQFMSDAKWLYEWGDGVEVDSSGKQVWMSGTPVIIQHMFNYDRKYGPWLDLKNNKDSRIKLEGNPMKVEEAYIPFQQIPEEIRGWIPQKERYKVAEDTLRARGYIADDVKLTPSINFNKLRREKREKRIQDSLRALEKRMDSVDVQSEEEKTDMEIIKKNLEELEGKEVEEKKDTTERH